MHGGGGAWSAYQAIKHIYYGDDWSKDVITPQTRFFNDVSNGTLPAVSRITPTCVNSDHAGCGSNTGPDWVASLVNAIGESQYWDSTVIFVFWDDYGGWYDHVPPKLVDYDGLGIRVPLLVVSAYARKGYVSHVRLRARQHPEVRRRPVALAEALGERRARQPHCPGLLRLLAAAEALYEDTLFARQRVLSPAVARLTSARFGVDDATSPAIDSKTSFAVRRLTERRLARGGPQ